MIPLFREPIQAKPDANYINFRDPYLQNIEAIMLTNDALYLPNNHLFVQLIRQCSLSSDQNFYYRSSVMAVRDYLIKHRYGSFNFMGRLRDPVFFAKPIMEAVLHHSEFPGTKLFLDSEKDPSLYEPVRLVYHPFDTLHYRYLDGKYNPPGDITDPYVYYIINIPELVLQWRSYQGLMSKLGEDPSITDYVSLYIIMPLMRQYANISLFNRYMNHHLGKPYGDDPKDHRFGFNVVNHKLLQRGIERNRRTNNKFGLDHLLSLVPSLYDEINFYTTKTTTETINGKPFTDLSRLTILINLFKLLPIEEERGTKAKLDVYIKRMIRGKEYKLFLGNNHYPYFESRLNELRDIIF